MKIWKGKGFLVSLQPFSPQNKRERPNKHDGKQRKQSKMG